MSTPSFFDLFQPPQKQGGLSGLALKLQQQGGPRGLGQALGAGLLGASQFAQEALPQVMQDPNAGFGAAFGASLLGGLGGPARQAQAKETKRQEQAKALQAKMLGTVFKGLDPKSQQQVMKKLGLGDLEMAKGESKTYQQTVRTLVGMIGKKGVPGKTQESIRQALSQDPSIRGIMDQIQISTGQDLPPENVLLGIEKLMTDDSIDKHYLNPDDSGYLDWRVLEVDPAKVKKAGGAGRQPNYQDQVAIQDFEKRKQLIVEGHSPENAAQLAVADGEGNVDELRLSNLERFMGVVAGTEPEDPFQKEMGQTARFYSIAAQGLIGSLETPEEIVQAAGTLRTQAEEETAGRMADTPQLMPVVGSARRVGSRRRLAPEEVRALRGQGEVAPTATPTGEGASPADAGVPFAPIPQAIESAPPDAQGFSPMEIYEAMRDLGEDMTKLTTLEMLDAALSRSDVGKQRLILARIKANRQGTTD